MQHLSKNNLRLEPAPEVEADEFLWGICSSWLLTAASVNSDRANAHRAGMATVAKAYVSGVRCPVCGVDYLSRLRVIQHLRGSR
jgi:hypothetical protein